MKKRRRFDLVSYSAAPAKFSCALRDSEPSCVPPSSRQVKTFHKNHWTFDGNYCCYSNCSCCIPSICWQDTAQGSYPSNVELKLWPTVNEHINKAPTVTAPHEPAWPTFILAFNCAPGSGGTDVRVRHDYGGGGGDSSVSSSTAQDKKLSKL